MNTTLNAAGRDSLPISLRLVRLLISVLLVIAVGTEITLSDFWQVTLSGLALYTLITGLAGRDPLFALLGLSNRRMSVHALGVVAQLECLSIGVICIVAGIMYHNVDSLVLRLLPFVGVYPILLCAVKHDVLGYLLQSYRNDMRANKTG